VSSKARLTSPGHALLAARRSRGWSQLQLVAAVEAVAREQGHRLPKRESLLTMLSRWERGHRRPDPLYRGLLSTALGREPVELFGVPEFAGAAASASLIDVTSHKFLPAYLGSARAHRICAQVRDPEADGRAAIGWAPLRHPRGEARLHVFPFGVGVVHLREEPRPVNLASLALWRRDSYGQDLGWASGALGELMGEPVVAEYVLSLYWLARSAWREPDRLATAMRLLSMPSVLLDREEDTFSSAAPGAELAEDMLLRDGFDHPEIESFGLQGVSIGCASWGGVAYLPTAPRRALTEDELLRFELLVQALWCYGNHMLHEAQRGIPAAVDLEYGERFLRACQSTLMVGGARETTQHRLMRDAVLTTSRLLVVLARAADLLSQPRALATP